MRLGHRRLDHPGSPVDRLIAASPAVVLTVIIEELSLLTTRRMSVEISINFSFTFLSSQGCLDRSFLAPTQCSVGDLIVKLFFVEERGRAFILEKQGQKFFLVYFDWKRGGGRVSNTQKVGAKNYSFDLYGKIKKTNSSVLRLVEGRRRASNTQKTRT